VHWNCNSYLAIGSIYLNTMPSKQTYLDVQFFIATIYIIMLEYMVGKFSVVCSTDSLADQDVKFPSQCNHQVPGKQLCKYKSNKATQYPQLHHYFSWPVG